MTFFRFKGRGPATPPPAGGRTTSPLRYTGLGVLLVLILASCAVPLSHPPGEAVRDPELKTDGFITADGVRLPLRVWAPKEKDSAKPENESQAKAPVLIALHGFNDYSTFFEDAAVFLADHGVTTYAYDQRGFGEAPNRGLWAGSKAYTDDLTAVASALRERHPGQPLYVLGDSFGGAVVLVSLTSANPPPVDGALLVAPAVWGRETMPWYQNLALWIASHTVPWLTLSGGNLDVTPSDNIEALRKLGRDPLVIKETRVEAIYGLVDIMDQALAAAPNFKTPALILYGEKDDVVPKLPTYELVRRLPEETRTRQRFALYPEGHHLLLRDLDAKRSWQDILAWVTDPKGELPSGADLNGRKVLAENTE